MAMYWAGVTLLALPLVSPVTLSACDGPASPPHAGTRSNAPAVAVASNAALRFMRRILVSGAPVSYLLLPAAAASQLSRPNHRLKILLNESVPQFARGRCRRRPRVVSNDEKKNPVNSTISPRDG